MVDISVNSEKVESAQNNLSESLLFKNHYFTTQRALFARRLIYKEKQRSLAKGGAGITLKCGRDGQRIYPIGR
jgi:hypothetical protein